MTKQAVIAREERPKQPLKVTKVDKTYFVYILTNKNNTVLYTGVTNNLVRRIFEHKEMLQEGFTKKYHCSKLVWYEQYQDSLNAISREKQIKGGSRRKKEDLINQMNPQWKDLYEEIL